MLYLGRMKHRQLNWEDARYLLAVARAGQLGRAAENLGVSVMTLSRHLNQLQHRVGTSLLTRHSKGMQLTNEGVDWSNIWSALRPKSKRLVRSSSPVGSQSLEQFELQRLKALR